MHELLLYAQRLEAEIDLTARTAPPIEVLRVAVENLHSEIEKMRNAQRAACTRIRTYPSPRLQGA